MPETIIQKGDELFFGIHQHKEALNLANSMLEEMTKAAEDYQKSGKDAQKYFDRIDQWKAIRNLLLWDFQQLKVVQNFIRAFRTNFLTEDGKLTQESQKLSLSEAWMLISDTFKQLNFLYGKEDIK